MPVIPVYGGTRYTTYVEGCVPKVVECEQCKHKYVYLFHARATGVAESPYLLNEEGASQSSQEQASFTLNYELEHGISVVPCPACGHIQEHMFSLVRQAKYGWMGAVVLPISIFAALAFVASLLGTFKIANSPNSDLVTTVLAFWGAFAVLFSAALAVHIRKKALSRAFDPNDEPAEDRLKRGKEMAISLEQFERQAQQAPDKKKR